MQPSFSVFQTPGPGEKILKFRGDIIAFELSMPGFHKGSAWLRTNIGHAALARKEIIGHVDADETPLAQDWFDIPMTRIDDRRFKLTLPLYESGHFQAKCLFIEDGAVDPVWPEGVNTAINVEPSDTCCANIIYNAFVRQFGPNKSGDYYKKINTDCVKALDAQGCTVIPQSGTFRDLIKELDFIMGTLGCRIIQLLPIYPTPTTFARMGRFGSPYAALNFTAVEPSLAQFDPKATPLDQFIELVDAVHQRNGKIIIDIAVNHTGWGAEIHETHPQWLVRDEDGRIQVPGAWGVLWEDLTKLDYVHQDLWQYIAEVFLTWCRRGVDGFRCDAGYMIPTRTWEYVISRVREQFQETIFLLEGLGGKISVMKDLLNRANFNWAYSELFQNYDRSQISGYLPEALDISDKEGMLIHFAETHDNLRLAAKSAKYAMMRTALCALCSNRGGFGFANGVEWLATEKIVVHEAHSLNWGASHNQVEHIRTLSRILRDHPAFHDQTKIAMIQKNGGNCIALLRHHGPSRRNLLILANLDDERNVLCSWQSHPAFAGPVMYDLLSGSILDVRNSDDTQSVELAPAQVLCLTSDPEELKKIHNPSEALFFVPEKIVRQRLRAKVLEAFAAVKGMQDMDGFDVDDAASRLAENPISFCQSLNRRSEEPLVTVWQWPRDLKREVMAPPGHFLLIRADMRFCAQLIKNNRVLDQGESLFQNDGRFFILFKPQPPCSDFSPLQLKLTVFDPTGPLHQEAVLLYLPDEIRLLAQNNFKRRQIRKNPMVFLATNGCGAMSRTLLSWGELQSRYDALLAANMNPEYPENRQVMFTRCRGWIVHQGYSYEISIECLENFYFEENAGYWQFHIPTGKGVHIRLTITVEMISGENSIRITFFRHPGANEKDRLDDDSPIRLILRPDIEDRNFHDVTKAYIGPEQLFRSSVIFRSNGFEFAPFSQRRLALDIDAGQFVPEPEWHYMVYRPLEAERGLEPDSDLFSPGYFSSALKGGCRIILSAAISGNESKARTAEQKPTRPDACFSLNIPDQLSIDKSLELAMDQYLVKRMDLRSVIAGYPWFLDWGRDALIFVRGLIAAGKHNDARAVLKQFGMFENRGMLPNMIVGQDAGNLDTSDAPLWFCLACADLIDAEGNEKFLEASYGNRKIRQVLLSIGNAYASQTPNGIRMDPESALIYSPGHFTWMDTNHPAGTPRQGYPIEIQALWFSALNLFCRIDTSKNSARWQGLADRVQASLLKYFYDGKPGYLADCLHGPASKSAAQAKRDDALRPNQLFAVTLGAVKDKAICRQIVAACEELLVPGAIRSLADRPVNYPIEIIHQGRVINDPRNPYKGKYIGDEDTRRKPAYHNGTAWTWVFPSFCEAWVAAYGALAGKTALSLLNSSARLLGQGCVGHIPEILDGDFPHHPRGCDAQAWGVSEWVRVFKKLEKTV
jgi:starch synthase (maltosyl-transferring)